MHSYVRTLYLFVDLFWTLNLNRAPQILIVIGGEVLLKNVLSYKSTEVINGNVLYACISVREQLTIHRTPVHR